MAAGDAPRASFSCAITALVEVADVTGGTGELNDREQAQQWPGSTSEQGALYAATILAYDWARRQSGTVREPPDGILTPDWGECGRAERAAGQG